MNNEVASCMRLITTTLILFVFLLTGCEKDKIAITTSSENARQEFITGRDLFEKLQFREASEHLEKAIALDSNFVMAYLYLSILQQNPAVRHQYIKKAKSAMEDVSEGERLSVLAAEAEMNGNRKAHEKYLQEIVEAYPRDERALTNLGTYYLAYQKFEKALIYFKRAIEANPAYPTVYNQIGYVYRYLDDYQAAEESFKKYIALIPDNPNPYDSYAELLLKMGEYDVSMETYQKALELDPDFDYSHFGLASNLIYMKEYNKARNQLKRMAKIASSDEQVIRAYYGSAITYFAEGNLRDGLNEIDAIIRISEKNSNTVHVIRNYYTKARILAEFDKIEEAWQTMKEGQSLLPKAETTPEIEHNLKQLYLFNAAYIAVKQNDLKSAKEYAEQYNALTENDDNPIMLRAGSSLQGLIAFYEKDYSTAIEKFEKADLNDPLNMFWLARAQMESGQTEQAILNLKKVIKYNGLASINYILTRIRAEKVLARLRHS